MLNQAFQPSSNRNSSGYSSLFGSLKRNINSLSRSSNYSNDIRDLIKESSPTLNENICKDKNNDLCAIAIIKEEQCPPPISPILYKQDYILPCETSLSTYHDCNFDSKINNDKHKHFSLHIEQEYIIPPVNLKLINQDYIVPCEPSLSTYQNDYFTPQLVVNKPITKMYSSSNDIDRTFTNYFIRKCASVKTFSNKEFSNLDQNNGKDQYNNDNHKQCALGIKKGQLRNSKLIKQDYIIPCKILSENQDDYFSPQLIINKSSTKYYSSSNNIDRTFNDYSIRKCASVKTLNDEFSNLDQNNNKCSNINIQQKYLAAISSTLIKQDYILPCETLLFTDQDDIFTPQFVINKCNRKYYSFPNNINRIFKHCTRKCVSVKTLVNEECCSIWDQNNCRDLINNDNIENVKHSLSLPISPKLIKPDIIIPYKASLSTYQNDNFSPQFVINKSSTKNHSSSNDIDRTFNNCYTRRSVSVKTFINTNSTLSMEFEESKLIPENQICNCFKNCPKISNKSHLIKKRSNTNNLFKGAVNFCQNYYDTVNHKCIINNIDYQINRNKMMSNTNIGTDSKRVTKHLTNSNKIIGDVDCTDELLEKSIKRTINLNPKDVTTIKKKRPIEMGDMSVAEESKEYSISVDEGHAESYLKKLISHRLFFPLVIVGGIVIFSPILSRAIDWVGDQITEVNIPTPSIEAVTEVNLPVVLDIEIPVAPITEVTESTLSNSNIEMFRSFLNYFENTYDFNY